MAKKNSKLFLLVFLGMLTAFGPFVTDMYLPTLPAMSHFFNTTSSFIQLGLTTSMIGLAVGQLLFGPLSDKYGRRLPLISALSLFLLSAIGCIILKTSCSLLAGDLFREWPEPEASSSPVQSLPINTVEKNWPKCWLSSVPSTE